LQHLLRIFEELTELISPRPSQDSGGELRGDLHARYRSILGDVSDFVHADAGVARERDFQLFRQGLRFGIAGGKSAHETGELRLRQIRPKMDAGDPGGGKQLREAAFRGRSGDGLAVNQDLVSRGAQKNSGPGALFQRQGQLAPGGLKLCRGFRVAELVQPRKLQQNI
jgi:hypothetical protein